MPKSVTQKLISDHLLEGNLEAGKEIGIEYDQTRTQDAAGTLVMLEFEAIGNAARENWGFGTYIDHTLIQADAENADDHLFLRSACLKFGMWYSLPGNCISHPLHTESFDIPGKTLLGADSHTCAAGSLGMLAVGAGGLEVATTMASEALRLKMPTIMGVKLIGQLAVWVSAKDVVLEMLCRHGVEGE